MKEILVKCERLDDQGRGIAKVNGKTTFINNFLPSEEATIKITLDKKKYSEGKIINLNKKSPDRIIPKCPYLNCGCALKHLDYKKTLKYKEDKVKNVLRKFGNIDPKINPIVHGNIINGYRNKITLKVEDYVGYYQNSSNDFLPIKKCELVSEKLNEIIYKLNTLDLKKVKEITIKEFDEIMIIIKGEMDITELKPYASSIYMNEQLVYGKEYVTTKLKDLTFKISKDAFFQINKEMTEKLYDIAIKFLGKDENKKVLDLYCGTGTISLLLSKYFKEITGIEINKEAVECANENKKINKIKNVSFICGDVSGEIENLQADFVVVDPPRSGLSPKGIKDILKINPDKIVYISCDPITLARDLKILNENYNVMEVTPVDMFPNTYHVENVVKLERK